MWSTNKYGATGFRLLVADLVLAVSQTLARNAERLERLHGQIDPIFQEDNRIARRSDIGALL